MRKELKEPLRRRLEGLGRVLGHHLSARAKLDLLLFWARNPGGWYTRRAIKPFSLLPRSQIDEALLALLEDGVVERREHNGVPFYALTENHGVRRAILELGRLTPNERRYLVHWAQSAFPSNDGEFREGEPLKKGLGRVSTWPD